MTIEVGMVNEDLASFLNMLKISKPKSKGLLQINLWNRKIGDEGARQIAETLKSVQFVENFVLDLGDNDITFDGIAYLVDALKSGNCPKGLWLGLWNNPIGDEGASMLAEALKNNKCPENLQLHLGHTQIGKIGVEELGKALKHSHCVKYLYLNLYSNDGIDEALPSLAEGLKSNTTAKLKICLNGEDNSSRERQFINIYNARNELIKYNPDYETYIKAICYKNDLYTPALKHEPMSLKECSGNSVFKQPFSAEALKRTLPKELIDYLEKLKSLNRIIQADKNLIRPTP